MFCRNCGKEISDTAAFCNGCGEKVVRKSQPQKKEPALIQAETKQPAVGKKPGAATVLGSLLCQLLVFVLSYVLIVLMTVRFMTNEKIIKNAFESFEISQIQITTVIDGEEETVSLAEFVADEISDENITQEDVEEIIEKFEDDDIISQVTGDFADYLFDDGKIPQLSANDIMDVIRDNEKLIVKTTGKSISDKDWAKIEKNVDSYVNDINENINDLNENINAIYSLKSAAEFNAVGLPVGIAVTGVFMALLLGLMILMYKTSGSGVYRAFRSYAIPTGIAGVSVTAASLFLPGVLEGLLPDNLTFIGKLVQKLVVFPVYSGLIVLGICLACVVMAIVFSAVYKTRKRRILKST